jgi:hypothetical protein
VIWSFTAAGAVYSVRMLIKNSGDRTFTDVLSRLRRLKTSARADLSLRRASRA